MKIMLTIAIIIILLGLFLYKILHPTYNISRYDHTTMTIGDQEIIFDYPVFKGWKTVVYENRIEYKPKSLWFVGNPTTIIEVGEVLYYLTPQWINVNKFGIGYNAEFKSVDLHDGSGGGVRFNANINSAPTTIPIDIILKSIAETFNVISKK